MQCIPVSLLRFPLPEFWFHDKNDNYGGKYQLTLRSLDDLEGFEYYNGPREYAEGERPQ